MAFTDYDAFLEAKKRMETLELRKADNSLTVDAAYEILLSGQVRKKRDQLLSSSDFRVLPDVPWPLEPWYAYRAELRDISSQPGFPLNVEWPTAPANS